MILFAACFRVQWCATVLYQHDSLQEWSADCRHTFIEDDQSQPGHFHESVAESIRKNRVRRYNDSVTIQNGIPDRLLGP
jgi:hypothetical protein